ncbi:hypothetical protein QTP88_005690 [Uroleucon formosanum]
MFQLHTNKKNHETLCCTSINIKCLASFVLTHLLFCQQIHVITCKNQQYFLCFTQYTSDKFKSFHHKTLYLFKAII